MNRFLKILYGGWALALVFGIVFQVPPYPKLGVLQQEICQKLSFWLLTSSFILAIVIVLRVAIDKAVLFVLRLMAAVVFLLSITVISVIKLVIDGPVLDIVGFGCLLVEFSPLILLFAASIADLWGRIRKWSVGPWGGWQ